LKYRPVGGIAGESFAFSVEQYLTESYNHLNSASGAMHVEFRQRESVVYTVLLVLNLVSSTLKSFVPLKVSLENLSPLEYEGG